MRFSVMQVGAIEGAAFVARQTDVEVLGQNEYGLFLRFASDEQAKTYCKKYSQAYNGALVGWKRKSYKNAIELLKCSNK